MIPPVPKSLKELRALIRKGEGSTLEFKQSTGELREAMQTVCAFLNGNGGMLLIGVKPDGRAEGQQVSDKTLRDIAQSLDRFEPPVNVPIERLELDDKRSVLMLRVDGKADSRPYMFENRANERVSNTTRKMPQATYEKLLLKRGHSRQSWENQPAEWLTLKDLDRKEILRTRTLAVEQNRISPDTSRDIGEILDRLGLRRNGVILQAAQVLYGTKLINDLPQCLLKLGRFRGTKVTGTIVDNRQEHLNAFAMVREGMAFLERTMPLGARFPDGKIFREDRFPIPLNALREILLNAVMHRDYSYSGGHVAVVVFDDRVEIRSYGRLPAGVTLEQLTGSHLSELRNPLIAGAFHRTGAVEIWGRGTNRVIDECERHGIEPPTFIELQGFLIVTFRAAIVEEHTTSAARTPQVSAQVTAQVSAQVTAQVAEFCREPKSAKEIMALLGLKHWKSFQTSYLQPLLIADVLERTIPNKPRSRLQKYRLTDTGRELVKEME